MTTVTAILTNYNSPLPQRLRPRDILRAQQLEVLKLLHSNGEKSKR